MAKKNRIRKSVKYTYIGIAVCIIIICLINLILNLSGAPVVNKEREIYNYSNNFDCNYDVQLLENRYISNDEIDDSEAFVTGLIDFTNFNLNYIYKGSESSNIKYTYSAVGKMDVSYVKDGKNRKIWANEENLLEEKEFNETSDFFKINESIKLDLKEKNRLLNDFKQETGIAISAKYIITFNVNVQTVIAGETVKNSFSRNIVIDLAEKTTIIEGIKSEEDLQHISKKSTMSNENSKYSIIVDGIIICVAFIWMISVISTQSVNRIKDDYVKELNKILKVCDDKIVRTNSKPMDKDEVIYVQDFAEILKVSEELFKPILYYAEDEEAIFSVLCGDSVYRYVYKK